MDTGLSKLSKAEDVDQVANDNALDIINFICHDLRIFPSKLAALLNISDTGLQLVKNKAEPGKSVMAKLIYLKRQLQVIKSYNILHYYSHMEQRIQRYNVTMFEVLQKGEDVDKYAAALKEENADVEETYWRIKSLTGEIDIEGCVDSYSSPVCID